MKYFGIMYILQRHLPPMCYKDLRYWKGRGQLNWKRGIKNNFYNEGSEAAYLVAQKGCGYPIPRRVQGQMRLWATYSRERFPVYYREVGTRWSLKVPCKPNYCGIMGKCQITVHLSCVQKCNTLLSLNKQGVREIDCFAAWLRKCYKHRSLQSCQKMQQNAP